MTKTIRAAAIIAGFCLLLPSAGCRYNDAFEPNDTYETATPVMAGVEILATVGQDNPDVFSIEAPAGKTIIFKLSHRGHEDCPEFTVQGPNETTLYQEQHGFCGDPPWMAETQAKGVLVSGKRGSGYELRIPAGEAGKYYLRIQERKQADNLFSYSWDYSLTALIE
ncbi:MAG: hypothetical protein KKH28_01120 [Elusimicrobia bacterium]|nr:hypothetical protein [Elusimicrobiota bacterium]